jgi:hypothetical protein
MPRRSKPAIDFYQERFRQISESHCGPAVIQMMLSYLGRDVTQEAVADAGETSSLITMQGMRVDQMALAVRRLAPEGIFYVKDHCTVEELAHVVQDYRYPVGVEWQGVFEDEDAVALDRANKAYNPNLYQASALDDSETGEYDYGHYSLVVRADRRRRQLIIADPYKDFFSQARVFDFAVFDRRWYDYNGVPDPLTGEETLVKDDHLMFLIARRNILFPSRLGMHTIGD